MRLALRLRPPIPASGVLPSALQRGPWSPPPPPPRARRRRSFPIRSSSLSNPIKDASPGRTPLLLPSAHLGASWGLAAAEEKAFDAAVGKPRGEMALETDSLAMGGEAACGGEGSDGGDVGEGVLFFTVGCVGGNP